MFVKPLIISKKKLPAGIRVVCTELDEYVYGQSLIQERLKILALQKAYDELNRGLR